MIDEIKIGQWYIREDYNQLFQAISTRWNSKWNCYMFTFQYPMSHTCELEEPFLLGILRLATPEELAKKL
jgi:hypothetical protein